MTGCAPFGAAGPDGIADALQKVDCLTTDATSLSFDRLFGPHGGLTSALTILLTLYVGFFAVSLLTGRSTLRLSALTPRMMTMGLVLTFVTSWVAYQSVVWNLAVGAPDQIAATLLGIDGSATTVFAQTLDGLFVAVTNAADAMGAAPAAANAKLASPANILWLSSLLLLLGTVGVLVVCRIALAALLILGPVFIVFSLFDGTRGLFEGWLKGVVTFALVPLMTVLMGSGALKAIMPMVASLAAGGPVPLRTAVSILVASLVYVALMYLVFEVTTNLTRGWSLRKRSADPSSTHSAGSSSAEVQLVVDRSAAAQGSSTGASSDRVRSTVATLNAIVTAGNTSPALVGARGGSASRFDHGLGLPAMAVTSGRHASYFNHRTRFAPPPSSRGVIR